ncbi:hypothetical protein O3P69_001498 [Scylla paramamosain]|uniref:Uncharacterized protein n=1 Tax=Scylla paramamosain TaxID=85552 RepID=A0AAW0V0D4_SCYPA
MQRGACIALVSGMSSTLTLERYCVTSSSFDILRYLRVDVMDGRLSVASVVPRPPRPGRRREDCGSHDPGATTTTITTTTTTTTNATTTTTTTTTTTRELSRTNFLFVLSPWSTKWTEPRRSPGTTLLRRPEVHGEVYEAPVPD